MYVSSWQCIHISLCSYDGLKCFTAKLFYKSQGLELFMQVLKGKNWSKYETHNWMTPVMPHVRQSEGGVF